MLEGGVPQGELDEVSKGRVIDWGFLRILEKFGSLEELFAWSSPEESSKEEEWETGGSHPTETQSEAGQDTQPTLWTPVPCSKLFVSRPSITQTRAPTYRQ